MISDLHDSAPFLPFDSLAGLPKQPQRNRHATQKPKRKARVISPQPIVAALQSTQAPQPLWLMNLRVIAPPSPKAHAALPLRQEQTPAPTPPQQLASPQPYVSAPIKKLRASVRIAISDDEPHYKTTTYGGYCTSAATVRCSRACRRYRHESHTQSTEVARPPWLMNLCISAPPSPISPAALPHTQAFLPQPSTTQHALGPKSHLNSVRNNTRSAMKIVSAAVHLHTQLPNPPQFVCTPAHNSNPLLARAPAFQDDSRTKPAARVSMCCAVSQRSSDALHHRRYKYLLRTGVFNQSARDSHVPPMNSADDLMTREQNVKGAQAARTRTLDPLYNNRLLIPGNERAVCPRALNGARPLADTLITARPPPLHAELVLFTSEPALTPTVLPKWQHLYSPKVANRCALVSRTQSDTSNYTQHNPDALYINCSPPACQPSCPSSNYFSRESPSARRRLLLVEMNAKAKERVNTAVLLKKPKAVLLIERLREYEFYEVVVENLDRALLAVIAGESHITMRDSLRARIADVDQPLSELCTAALIPADMDAHELNVRSLAGSCAMLRYDCALAK